MIHLIIAAGIFLIVTPLSVLLYRIIFPTILSFPWQLPSSVTCQKLDKERTVVFAGSFNPPHWGHLVMIRYLTERYGRVICCIGVNPNKRYDVTPQTRAQILREMLRGDSADEYDGKRHEKVQVEVVSGYIWRYAKTQNTSFFYRGIRTWSADGHDERQLQILNTWGPLLLGPLVWPLKTIFLEGDPKYRHVSSTVTRHLCSKILRRRSNHMKGTVDTDLDELANLVPEWIREKVVDAYGTEFVRD